MNRSLLVLTALTATLFAGCNPCFNVECDAPDTAMINALRFRFSTADFAWGEVDSAMVVRYAKGSSVGIDTFRLADQFAAGDSVITLTDGTPFAGAETFGNFDYAHIRKTAAAATATSPAPLASTVRPLTALAIRTRWN
jgi:hypothetical protein